MTQPDVEKLKAQSKGLFTLGFTALALCVLGTALRMLNVPQVVSWIGLGLSAVTTILFCIKVNRYCKTNS